MCGQAQFTSNDRQAFHRRLRRPDHHGQRRSRPAPALAGKARRGRARGPVRQPHRSARFATEELNRHWYERNTGQVITDIQRQVRHPSSAGWRPPSTAGSKQPEPCLRPSSCCPGRSRRRRPPKNICRSCSTTCGSPCQGGGALGDHRRRQMGRDHHLGRSALPAPHRHGRAEVLALRRKRRAPSPIRRRAAEAAHRGGAHRRHELSNAWAEFAGIFPRTRAAHLEHEKAKSELKSLMPEDAKEAIGHGVRAKRSKSGA